ncbi:hypothetical protein N9189_01005 [Pirellulaceae bacterium]|nr:hypothetical protein [Pirellulaceae bacterium]
MSSETQFAANWQGFGREKKGIILAVQRLNIQDGKSWNSSERPSKDRKQDEVVFRGKVVFCAFHFSGMGTSGLLYF